MDLDKVKGLQPHQRKALEEHCLKIGEPIGEEVCEEPTIEVAPAEKEEVKIEVEKKPNKGRRR